uniref:Alsin Rho guanine nucleotide exchange factor ALS2 a n=1 Tax=Gasterosteus aculeatus aculeatus TaxID=481459 RepID=A0AAQ4PAV9_GASAC
KYAYSHADERAPTPPERGLLHIWQSAGPSAQLCPDRVLLSRPVLQASLGEHHGLLLTQGGQVYSFGELLWRDLSVPVSAPLLEISLLGRTVVRVAAGGFHCGALSEQGNVFMWGENTAGQCGLSERVSEPCPVSVVDSDVVPPAAVQVVDLALGREHSLALSARNELWAWGSGCQLGLVTNTFPVWRPQKVEHLAGRHVVQVACGAYHSLALVRSLHQQNTPELTEGEEPFAADAGHYCPLGVELTEVMTHEVTTSKIQKTVLNKLVFKFILEKHLNVTLTVGSCFFLSGSPRQRRCSAGRPSSSCRSRSAAPEEAGGGLPSLETEVWSWGRGSEGQLGHGDQLARLQPLCIKCLTGEEVIKVAAGSHHSLALTAHCQVTHTSSLTFLQPSGLLCFVPRRPLQLSDGLRVWDVSAGQSHSLLLADGDCVQPVLLYCGPRKDYAVRPDLLPFCVEMGYISGVCSGGQSCAALADVNVMGFIGAIHELASRERRFYCWLSSVKRLVLTPLQSASPSLGEPCTHLFFSLCESFVRLSLLIGQHSTALSYFLHDVQGCDIASLPLLTHSEHFLDVYNEYCSSVGDFQVMGGFRPLHKLSLECLGSQQAVLAQLCEPDQSAGGKADLVSLLYWPLQQLHQYSRMLLKLAACYNVLTTEYQSLDQGGSRYDSQSSSLLRRKKEAETTSLFWSSHSGKTTEVLRLPQRRVVCESGNRSLTLQNAGRFSNHWFILFNDTLVHTQVRTHTRSVPLQTQFQIFNFSDGYYAIKITCPEESFTLVASTPQEKNKWLRSLNQAVDHVLGGAGQGSSPGLAAMSRTASHTFCGEGRFKDAHYTGAWVAGRIHGRGTMKWPDGRTYSGNFKSGQEDGYGECLIPDKVLNKPDGYQGHWRDGKIHGFGKYKYASGEVYEGCFCDGHRHGYGMLSSGRMAKRSSSVFIGQWVHDKKTGYGVHDDITRGEKYMGLWLDEQRHGNATVVTQCGLYYEGNFRDNKMCGPGLLVSDDDTALHGEFSEDWMVNGKGVLSLANGDSLEGMFSGEWTTGLKVVGTYFKPSAGEPEHKERSGLLPNLSRSQSKVLECLECIPQHGEPVTTANYDNIRRYLIKACETPHHPLGWLVETLVTAYRMTYVGVGSNRRLLRLAVQEVLAYLTHFYRIVRFLFPGLPDDGGIIPDPPTSTPESKQKPDMSDQRWVSHRGSDCNGCAFPSPSLLLNLFFLLLSPCSGVVVLSFSSLLLPQLLPRLYPPLFTLYCLQEEQEDARYWERMLRLNKQPDRPLLRFLGVQDSKDACFVSAVETLQQISTAFTPSDKLLVIQKTFEELTQEVKLMLDDSFLWCMDDLLPLFIYVVLRARIRNLGAEVSLIEDLMDPNIQHGEMGLMFTTLQACYMQILQESAT